MIYYKMFGIRLDGFGRLIYGSVLPFAVIVCIKNGLK
jgi:hypothetical protein